MAQDTELAEEGGEAPERLQRWAGALRSIVLPLGILAVILGGLWYWDDRGGVVSDDPRYGVVELPPDRNVTGQRPLAEVGRAGPDFLLERPEGGELRFSDLQGQPILLNFWASWCQPCRAEIPELVATFDRYQDRGLVIVGVDLQEADGTVREFADEFGITFPIAIDRDGELRDVWRLGGPFDGIPTSYFIDDTGVIRELFYGPMEEKDIEELLVSILPEPAP